jgi:hypothetical protein
VVTAVGVSVLAVAVIVLIAASGRSWLGQAPPPVIHDPTLSAPVSATPSTTPTPEITASPVYDGPLAATPAQAVANARAWGVAPGRFGRIAVMLLDRETGDRYGAGDVDAGYRTASLVKLFLAARMLTEHQPFDSATQDLMWRMITCSDDDAASTLWSRLGRAETIAWVIDHYDISTGLSPPPPERPGSWGLTSVSASALATFYDRVIDDGVVGPWLLDAMRHATPEGCDDYYQHFGLPSAAASWRVKQGWIHSWNGHAYLHSTGFIENDRYIAVLLTEGPSSLYDGTGPGSGRWALTGAAQALLPHGHVPSP